MRERIGKKIDQVLEEIRHEAVCESNCCAAPVALMERPPEESTVDPTAEVNGAMAERSPVDHAAGGNCFHNPGMVWDVMSGKLDCICDISAFLDELDENPRLRASANLRTMSRVREHLVRIPEGAAMGDPVELRLQDVLVLMDQLMHRMR